MLKLVLFVEMYKNLYAFPIYLRVYINQQIIDFLGYELFRIFEKEQCDPKIENEEMVIGSKGVPCGTPTGKFYTISQ